MSRITVCLEKSIITKYHWIATGCRDGGSVSIIIGHIGNSVNWIYNIVEEERRKFI